MKILLFLTGIPACLNGRAGGIVQKDQFVRDDYLNVGKSTVNIFYVEV